ncbi:hypothetical protein ACFUJY_29685 [Streptomyces sp. NPDC057249]|uniref:hypothetical protein n=1 Tax=Streptomyces sp. NPDC057249 TaxID=3346067 RepID=UPI00362C3AD2
MPGVSVETVSIPIPNVAVQSPSRRGDNWRLMLKRSRHIFGRGSTLRAAKEQLAQFMTSAAETAHTKPGFARDDNGALIVAIDRPWGVDEYRITDAGHRLTGSYARDADPATLLAKTHHYTVLPARGSGQSVNAPRPPLFTIAQIEQALSVAHERASEFRTDQGALDIFQGAFKALLANPDSQYPLPDDDTA